MAVNVSQAQCARMFGVDRKTIRNWIEREAFPVAKPAGRTEMLISMAEAIRWFAARETAAELAHLRAKLDGHNSQAVVSRAEEVTKLIIARRTKTELETAVMSGKLVDFDEFVVAASEAMQIISMRDEGMAGRLAAELAAMSDAAAIRVKLLHELRANRAEAALRLQSWGSQIANGGPA